MLSLLKRHYTYSTHSPLSSSQKQMDEMSCHFVEQASDWKALTAMTLGGFAYRVGKLGALSSGAKLSAPLFGLASEVAVFRGASSLLGSSNSPSYLTTYLDFASLKVFGFAARNTNPFFSHFIQDAGMVAGHHLTYALRLTTAPQGNITDQFLYSEITNLQMGFGMTLCHQLTQGRILAFEKALDLKIEFKPVEISHDLNVRIENFSEPKTVSMNAVESSAEISSEQITRMNRITEAARQEREVLVSLQEPRKILFQGKEGEVELLSTHNKQVFLKLKGHTYVLVSANARNYQFNKVGASGGLLLPIFPTDPIALVIQEWFHEGRIVIEKTSAHDIAAHYPRMTDLQQTYLDQLRVQNAVVSEEKIPLWKFIENLDSVPEWLRVYAQENPYLEVQKISFIPDRLGEEGGKGAHFLANMMRDVQNNWHLPIASLSNLYKSGEEYVLSLSLMPAALLMESRPLLPGRQPINLNIGEALVSHEEVVSMMADDTRPFLIADRPNALHNLQDLHPFIQMIHDYAHLLIMDKLSPQQRADLLTIYQSCLRLPASIFQSALNDETLGRILEGTFPNSGNNLFVNLFKMVKNPHLPVDFLIAWRTELESSFPEGHPSKSAVFKAFEMLFGKSIQEYLARQAGGSSRASSASISTGSSFAFSMPLEGFDPTWDPTNGSAHGSEFNGVMPGELIPAHVRNPGVAHADKGSAPNASGPIATPVQAQAIRNVRERFFSLWGVLFLRGTTQKLSFSKNNETAEMYHLSSTATHEDLSWYQKLRATFYKALQHGYHHAFFNGQSFSEVELRFYANQMKPFTARSSKEFKTEPFKAKKFDLEHAPIEGKLEPTFAREETRNKDIREIFAIRPTPEEIAQAEQQSNRFIESHPAVHKSYRQLVNAKAEYAQLEKKIAAENKEHRSEASDPDITAKVFFPPHWQDYLRARDVLMEAEESFVRICSEALGYKHKDPTLNTKPGLTRHFLADILWKRFYRELENLLEKSRPLPQEEVQAKSIEQAVKNNEYLSPHYPKIAELQESYVKNLRENGKLLALNQMTLRQFIETLDPSTIPTWLQEYVKQYPELPVKKISFDDTESGNAEHALIEETFNYIESSWKLPPGTLYKNSRTHDRVMIDCVLLPASLLMDARQLIPGSQPVKVEVTDLMSSHEKTIELASHDTRPLLIGDQSNALHGAKDVHPYLQTIHDYVHLLFLDGLTPQVRADLLKIYQSAQRLREVKELQLNDSILGRIPEATFLNPDENIYLSAFYLIEDIELSPESLIELRVELDASFPEGHPHRRKILDSFDICFGWTIEKYLDVGSLTP